MGIDIELVFKLPPEDVLPIDIHRFLLWQSSEADKLVKNPFPNSCFRQVKIALASRNWTI